MSHTLARAPLRWIVLLWLGWAAILLGYQALAPGRFEPQRPDRATAWSADETRADSHKSQPYILDRFLNAQVAWDSEYYISIALNGYDDPAMRAIAPGSDLGAETSGQRGAHPGWTPVSYAFFPAYPLAMRVVAWPLKPLGLTPVATVTLAGVVVSLAGTLAAMIAIAELAAGAQLAERGDGLRAAAYLLVWPASFFLAQVYTEGLFLGLSFGALALARRDRWLWAGVFAALATFTRSTGALLLLPLGWMWLQGGGPGRLRAGRWSGELVRLAAVGAPAAAYLAWRAVFGARFDFIETHHFGRGLMWLSLSWDSWREAFGLVASGDAQARAYYLVEVWGVAAAAVATLLLVRRDPALALYGLAILVIALTSGAAQGMHRYVLSLPALFLVPARLGRQPVFDRLWTLGNTLALAVFCLAFSWDFWAG
ncbi:MAG TPA: mannosyltransferase family protein [Phenylobacterium sp.]|uniref:mannosyltransferase family protein n=1 Tax=Phenylobacterium sp. TaxID=1871053 RepID=UPI002B464A05|nr:mannosyltransferase family protein [Phenylobacterium sp.]HKR89948.1 mannosyltransferase family protein [Phenylobacterium sp.]